MKIHKSTYQQMDELFKEARQEKPLVDIKEVQHIVNAGNYVPSLGTKGFHIGINSFIVVSGIVISSLLTYFTVKQDQPKVETKPAVVANTVQKETPAQTAPLQNTSVVVETTASTAKVEPALKKADKVRPASNQNKLVASTDNNVVLNDAAANQTEATVAAEPAAEVAVSKKTLVNQFTIKFDYGDQKVEMILTDGTCSMLTVDGRVIPADEYVSYEEVIESGSHFNAGKGAELTKYFDSHLRAEKILTSETRYVFELTSTQLLINHVAQSSDVFKRYKKLYEDKTGKVIVEGSVYKFENGATPE